MAQIERINMAEGPLNTEEGASSGPPAASNTENQSNTQSTKSLSRWGFLSKLRPQGGRLEAGTEDQPDHTAQIRQATPPNYTREQLSKIPAMSRFAFLKALPPNDQLEAMRVLGLELMGSSGPDWVNELEEANNQRSKFQETRELYENLAKMNLHRDKIPTNRRADFDQLLKDTEHEMDELVAGALANPVLAFVRKEILEKYMEATQAAPPVDTDSYYPSPVSSKTKDERLKDIQNALGRDKNTGQYNYEETFWEYGEDALKEKFGVGADIQALRSEYEGIASYIASRVAISIEKEFRREPLIPEDDPQLVALGRVRLERVGDNYFVKDIKEEARRINEDNEQKRQRERRVAHFKERLHWSPWRERFDFVWAQNADELNETVLDWLEFFQQQLPQEAAEKVNQSVQTGRQNALNALEAALHRIEIPPKSKIAKELRATIEGHVDVIGGVQLLESPGGFEAYTAYLEDFSNNFNPHHDAVYLRNPKAAIIHDFLSQNDGEICLGGPDSLEKPLDGDTKDFRADLEEKAKLYAATHELYIRKEDFDSAELGRAEIIKEIQQLNLPSEEANAMYQKRLAEKMGRYSWNDEIEELLLTDQRHRDWVNNNISDPVKRAEAIAKIDGRTQVFNKIKARLDEKDGLTGLSPDARKAEIRKSIWDQMGKFGNKTLTTRIKGMPPGAEQDRELWRWVKNYNSLRERNGLEGWFPTSWDMVRLSINTQTKLIDRVLSKTEFRAMVEEIDDPYAGLTEEQTREQMLDEFREGFRGQLAGLNLTPQQEEEKIDQEVAKRAEAIRIRIEDVVFDREKRRAEAERAFTVGRAYQKFLGLDARWGGLTTRVDAQNGGTKLRTISSLARDILKAKIDKEAQEIEDKVTQFALTLPNNLTQKQKEAAMTRKKRLFRRNAVFAATLGLREIGIANDLPIWNYHYYGDVSQIQAFAPLVGYTHNDKGYLPELLDRGRREMEAVYSHLADEYMDGKILVVQDDPIIGLHQESLERARVISEGGELAQRDVFESRFMVSTSGGVKVPDLISKIGDLGVYDLLWENGCQDLREFQGFIKRRDEVELREQSFWNIRKWADPIKYAQRLRGAGAARTFLVGGEVKGQGWVPGTFNEPYDGLWRLRGLFANPDSWLNGVIRKRLLNKDSEGKFIKALMQILDKKDSDSKDPLKDMDPIMLDEIVKTGGGILKNLIDYMNSRRYVTNRAGYATKNWQYDNELIARAFFQEAAKRMPIVVKKGSLKKDGTIAAQDETIEDVGGEILGRDNLAYAAPGRTKVANELFEAILRTSSYHILSEADRRVFDGKAKEAKEDMDKMRATLESLPLPVEIQDLINAKRAYLTNLHTSSDNIAKEEERIRRQYIERKLHMEFVGEWAARLFMEKNS